MNSLIPRFSDLTEQDETESIIACNAVLEQHGLSITHAQAVALSDGKRDALCRTSRVEFRSGTVEKLIHAFADSPYINRNNFVDVLRELIDLFYESRNETMDIVTDDELIVFMKHRFDGVCAGSIELLAGRDLPALYRGIRNGETHAQYMEKHA